MGVSVTKGIFRSPRPPNVVCKTAFPRVLDLTNRVSFGHVWTGYAASVRFFPFREVTPLSAPLLLVAFHLKVRIYFPPLIGHAAILQTMDPTDGDSMSAYALDPAARLTSLQKNPVETRPRNALISCGNFFMMRLSKKREFS